MASKKSKRASQGPKAEKRTKKTAVPASKKESFAPPVADAAPWPELPAPGAVEVKAAEPKTKSKRTQEAKPPKPEIDFDALRKPAGEAKAALDVAIAESKKLIEQAETIRGRAQETYRDAVAPYREACRRAGRECEFEGGRREAVSDRVSFIVEKRGPMVIITVKGRPETEEAVALKELNKSIGKVAYAYTDKHLGPREVVGNKGGTLSNKLRAVLDEVK